MGIVMRDKEREGRVQMLPMLQGENCISPVSATGLMMYCELASQVVVDSGQQVIELVSHSPLQEQPSAHYISHEYEVHDLRWSGKRELTSCYDSRRVR